jgi:ribosomal protein S18 acetylase RimI-like enzyme
MRIERPQLSEIDAIADLWVDLASGQRAYGSHLSAEPNRTAVSESITRHVVSGGVLVARTPEIAGFVMFGPEAGSYEQDVDRGIVHNLYVRPQYRGRGIGTALLDAAEDELFERGADAVAIEAMAANADAIRLYERLGYRPHRVELEKSVENDNKTRGDR